MLKSILTKIKGSSSLNFSYDKTAYSNELLACLKKRILDTEEAKYLLSTFPEDIRKMFIKNLFEPENPEIKKISEFLLKNSEMSRMIQRSPGSAEAFEYLYLVYNSKEILPIDRYYLISKAGHQIHERLVALKKNIPLWLNKIYKGKKILIDNVGSGPGRDMIEVLKNYPEWKDKVHIRNIDPDPAAINIGKKLVKELNMDNSFLFICDKYSNVELVKADLIVLVGVLCPLPMDVSKRVMKSMRLFSHPDGLIIFSTAQKELIYDDPLTDFLMKINGWHMSYKTNEDVLEIAKETGWDPVGEFYDEPLRHHKMTVARLK
jgi:hypothetical protein